MAHLAQVTARDKKADTRRNGLATLPLFVEPAWMQRQDGAAATLRRRPYHDWVF